MATLTSGKVGRIVCSICGQDHELSRVELDAYVTMLAKKSKGEAARYLSSLLEE